MEVAELIAAEEKRQNETLTLIPSENYASGKVRAAAGSIMANKYAEGYPGKRYYQGNEFVDKLERECRERVKRLFGVEHANVQPLSGAAANLAIIWAVRQSKEDVQLSQLLSSGGHLSMGQNVSVTKAVMPAVHYTLRTDGEINWEELEQQAMQVNPRIIWAGGTAYTRIFNWKRYREIADRCGAYFVADISHIGGLVVGGAHPSPVDFADVVMTTTHKSLRGPRGAVILVTKRGLEKDAELAAKIDKAVFPGVQGGPHMETVAGILAAVEEAESGAFADYTRQVVANAKHLAGRLIDSGLKLVGNGTENHMVWMDLSGAATDGWAVAWTLEGMGIVANRQTVPQEARSPYYPSGLRLGTPAVTTRGMRENEMEQIADWVSQSVEEAVRLSKEAGLEVNAGQDREADQLARKKFKELVNADEKLRQIAEEVKTLARQFPLPQ